MKKCPHCGACPTCGARPPYQVHPLPYAPYVPPLRPYPYPPYPWQGVGGYYTSHLTAINMSAAN